MKFRTEEIPAPSEWKIDTRHRIALLGSCFADAAGSRLLRDGFNVVCNPLGPLYNPCTLASLVSHLLDGEKYTHGSLTPGPRGWHCLDFASRYSGTDANAVLDSVNNDFATLFPAPDVLVLTFGTSWVFEMEGKGIVGNCHKLDSRLFTRRRLEVQEIVDLWQPLLNKKIADHVILTVSPIRHLADGLHGNQISKATLLLAVEELCKTTGVEYFPAYELLLDDLRDYRFYASDMKHPSEIAEEYIYEAFLQKYCTAATAEQARLNRKAAKFSQHRPILQ